MSIIFDCLILVLTLQYITYGIYMFSIFRNNLIVMQDFYVYILLCNDGSYYVGHTDNIETRLSAHEQRHFPRCYTASRLPVKLVYLEETASRDEAFRAERQLKRWKRSKKQALIDGNIESLKKLAKSYWT